MSPRRINMGTTADHYAHDAPSRYGPDWRVTRCGQEYHHQVETEGLERSLCRRCERLIEEPTDA